MYGFEVPILLPFSSLAYTINPLPPNFSGEPEMTPVLALKLRPPILLKLESEFWSITKVFAFAGLLFILSVSGWFIITALGILYEKIGKLTWTETFDTAINLE